MNEIIMTFLLFIGLLGFSFLIGLACFYWGRYDKECEINNGHNTLKGENNGTHDNP